MRLNCLFIAGFAVLAVNATNTLEFEMYKSDKEFLTERRPLGQKEIP